MQTVTTWWQVKNLIEKATADDTTVTTGFVYNEINSNPLLKKPI